MKMKKLKILFIIICAFQLYYLFQHRSNFKYEIIKNPFHKDAGIVYALSPAVIESKEIIDSNVRWIGYLSSTSVYGNYNGEEVNENSKLRPKESLEINRVKAEQDLLDFGTKYSILVEIFRLSGIYGNNKNVK